MLTTSLSCRLYDLCTSPEVIPDLRKEISSVIEETDGVMTYKALFKMKLLDSFMRESQRFHPTFTGKLQSLPVMFPRGVPRLRTVSPGKTRSGDTSRKP